MYMKFLNMKIILLNNSAYPDEIALSVAFILIFTFAKVPCTKCEKEIQFTGSFLLTSVYNELCFTASFFKCALETLKAPITTASDDKFCDIKFCDIFPYFRKK